MAKINLTAIIHTERTGKMLNCTMDAGSKTTTFSLDLQKELGLTDEETSQLVARLDKPEQKKGK